ncbi:MAG: heme lyase CcmF/NrfE family subunit [Pseudomonadales bacterium]
MIPELGHFSLILALGLAVCLFTVPAFGVLYGRSAWMQLSRSLAAGLFVFVLLSFGCLIYAFVTDDFSVNYVANNSNSALPDYYKVSAVWGAHEGSFLLWTLIMTGWTLAVAVLSRGLTLAMRARVLAVMGFLSFGFILFMLMTSNPFDRSLPIYPDEGADLNPLLQDFGLIVHPPMLYMGYVGFSVPFAFAIATLLSGQLDSAWARWSRPWTNVAWACLAAGITLGSWWAYYELGWGGWWFWDAVENASFLPWLVGTALIHSLAATEKRGVFKSWTVLLAIFAFSLSLLGAFLVRSGVLVSVHSFAVDPERGLFILGFLTLVVGGSLTLYAIKAAGIKSESGFDFTSRETLVLINNVLLVVAASAVLLGTIYPLIYEAMTGGKKISVGPPYFNAVFVPVVMVMFIAMAVSPFSRWRHTPVRKYVVEQWPWLVASFVVMCLLLLALASRFELVVAIVNAIALWILLNLVRDGWYKISNKKARVAALLKQSPSYYGMWLAHLGIAIAMTGVVTTVYFSEEKDVRLEPGEVVKMAGHEFRFEKMSLVQGPNYVSNMAEIKVLRNGKAITSLYPEKRRYNASGNVMTEADMDAGLFRDLYVALGEPVGDTAWAVRVHYKPFVRWIWMGGLFIAVGGLVTVFDRRYRVIRMGRRLTAPTAAPGVTA